MTLIAPLSSLSAASRQSGSGPPRKRWSSAWMASEMSILPSSFAGGRYEIDLGPAGAAHSYANPSIPQIFPFDLVFHLEV